ncbi:MAG: 6-pyruvoyl-tetrahydropterin synthase-related protein, partial [Anaerolineae bacterium]
MTERGPVRRKYRIWLLLVGLLCLVAVFPLLRTDPPCTHDGSAHYFRVVALRQALREGIVFTRYLPDLAFGYGYPFFNYRAPLPYYLVLGFHLTGIGLPLADNLTYALCILGSALAAYVLARDLFGPRAGIVAAIAYAYAPYQFLDALLRGNLPESVALPLMPLTLWAFRRLALTGRRRWFLASVAALASLYLSHNISSLLFTPFLVAFLFVLWLVYRRTGHWWAVGVALVLALGLTAFFWGPALLEREYVQLHMSYTTRNNDFHHNFLPLTEILSPPVSVDTSLMNPPIRVHLGLGQALLAGVGLVVGLIRWRDRERRAQLVLFAVVAVGLIWMSTQASLPLWEHIPLLRFVQFPWRLVGRATLPIALLAWASVSAIPLSIFPDSMEHPRTSRRARWTSALLVAGLVALLILSAFPYTYPPFGYCSRAPHPTINDLFRYEHNNERAGLAASGSFFPVWVKQRPSWSPLQDQYATGSLVARFDETALPEGAEVVESDYGANRARLIVTSPEPFRARYLSFYFPGWRVWVDGEETTVTPSDPEGLITFPLPAGRHTVRVRFGETRLRRIADVVSLASLLGLIAAVLVSSTAPPHLTSPRGERNWSPFGTAGALLLVAGLL